MPLPGVLAELGVDPQALLADVGLDEDAFGSPDNVVPGVLAVRLLEEGARRARCPHLGVLVGQQWRREDFGVIGEIMQCAANVGEALRSFGMYQRLYSQAAAAYFAEYAHSAELGFAVHHPLVDEGRPIVHDFSTAAATSALRALCGPGWRATEVELPRARPADVEPYRRHFRCPIRFDAPQAVIRFPLADMRTPLATADPARKRALEEAVLARLDRQLLPLLYRSLRLLLIGGDVSGDALVRQLAIHRRTLNRRLQAHGTTFKTLLDEVRYDVARELLRETRMPILAISGAIGYADGSCFTRAFRGWSGMSPAEWRASHRSYARATAAQADSDPSTAPYSPS